MGASARISAKIAPSHITQAVNSSNAALKLFGNQCVDFRLKDFSFSQLNCFRILRLKNDTGFARKIPLLDTLVDSAVQGTVSAFLTVLIGYKTKKYLCSDYKKQEKLDAGFEDGVDVGDDEVKIASAWAKRIRVENERGRHETNA